MLGEQKSTTALLTERLGAHVSIPLTSMRSMLLAIQSDDIATLINPGPVTEHESTISEVGSVFAISSPRALASFGFFLVEHMRIAMLLQNKQASKEARSMSQKTKKVTSIQN